MNEQSFVLVDVKEKSYLGMKKVDNREKCRGSGMGKLKTIMISKRCEFLWDSMEYILSCLIPS